MMNISGYEESDVMDVHFQNTGELKKRTFYDTITRPGAKYEFNDPIKQRALNCCKSKFVNRIG